MNFDDLLNKAANTANTAAGAAKRLAYSAKNNVNILAEEEKIKEAQREIGRLYCEAVQADGSLSGEAFDRQLEIIANCQHRIDELRRADSV